ncbi:MAG: hypothetical protein JSS05_09230 [Proteobacteria bacterium]|nr:hypothetical protein [Pseudomonadota bacterium]
MVFARFGVPHLACGAPMDWFGALDPAAGRVCGYTAVGKPRLGRGACLHVKGGGGGGHESMHE